ncbi:MAG: tail fiber domain-containing protein, partial [Anaerolineae bacterium]
KANRAEGQFSFAAGHQAIADADGSFVWADNHVSGTPFSSGVPNRFNVRATGGVYLALGLRGDGHILWSCYVADGVSWSCTSDRHAKENLALVDGAEILARLGRVPVYTWNGIGADPAVQHMGPMAQDFYAAFALGGDERTLATIDLDGVALAAIQELHAQSQERAARIEALEAETASQQAQIDQLAARLDALEGASPRPRKEEP